MDVKYNFEQNNEMQELRLEDLQLPQDLKRLSYYQCR